MNGINPVNFLFLLIRFLHWLVVIMTEKQQSDTILLLVSQFIIRADPLALLTWNYLFTNLCATADLSQELAVRQKKEIPTDQTNVKAEPVSIAIFNWGAQLSTVAVDFDCCIASRSMAGRSLERAFAAFRNCRGLNGSLNFGWIKWWLSVRCAIFRIAKSV